MKVISIQKLSKNPSRFFYTQNNQKKWTSRTITLLLTSPSHVLTFALFDTLSKIHFLSTHPFSKALQYQLKDGKMQRKRYAAGTQLDLSVTIFIYKSIQVANSIFDFLPPLGSFGKNQLDPTSLSPDRDRYKRQS